MSLRRRLLPLSIDTRLTLWYAAAMLVILVLISGGSYSLLAWSMAQDVDRSLITIADVVRDTAQGPDTVEATERWLVSVMGPPSSRLDRVDGISILRYATAEPRVRAWLCGSVLLPGAASNFYFIVRGGVITQLWADYTTAVRPIEHARAPERA